MITVYVHITLPSDLQTREDIQAFNDVADALDRLGYGIDGHDDDPPRLQALIELDLHHGAQHAPVHPARLQADREEE